MVDAVMKRHEWAPAPKGSLPRSWGNRAKHYLAVSSDITESADNGDTFPRELALANGFISELNRRYEFRGGLVVENFLRRHLRDNPRLGALLWEAYDVIRACFPVGTRLALEVVADPEALGDQQLFILIRTKFPRKVARAHLAELDQGWWLDVLPAAEGKMEIALE